MTITHTGTILSPQDHCKSGKGLFTPCVFQQSHSEGRTTLYVYMPSQYCLGSPEFFSSVGGKNTGIPPNESQYHHRTRLLESSTVTGWKSVSFPGADEGPRRGDRDSLSSHRGSRTFRHRPIGAGRGRDETFPRLRPHGPCGL